MAFKIAQPYQQIALPRFGGLYTEADSRSLPMGASPLCHDVDFNIAGVTVRPGLSKAITTYSPTVGSTDTWQFIKGFNLKEVAKQTLAQDASGGIWAEALTSEGVMNRIYSGLLNSARAIGEAANNRAYLALTNLSEGVDQPRQWDGQYLDRISQVGPGQAPSVPFTATAGGSLLSVVQPGSAIGIYQVIWGAGLRPSGSVIPPGTSIFCLFSPGTTGNLPQMKVGDSVYLSGLPLMGTSSTTGQGQNPNGTYTVTGIGTWETASGLQEYFSVQGQDAQGVASATALSGATYQLTKAMVHTSSSDFMPMYQSAVGMQIGISGTAYDYLNNNYTVIDFPTRGDLNVTHTQLSSNQAVYTYTLKSGYAPGWQPNFSYAGASVEITDPNGHVWYVSTIGVSGASMPAWPASPAAGAIITDGTVVWTYEQNAAMPITVSNAANGSGVFNVQQSVITAATQTTVTINLTNGNVGAASETGATATTGLGHMALIDLAEYSKGTGNPGTSPILGGSASGGTFRPVRIPPTDPNSDQVQQAPAPPPALPTPVSDVAPGTRYAICMFLTRNGFITPASPPVQFTTDTDTAQIQFTVVPIGPPNVIGRIIAITAANSGVGGPYYYIPQPVVIPPPSLSSSSQPTNTPTPPPGETVTVSATVINDNLATSTGWLTLSDTVLLASINVTTTGNNVQQMREIGEFSKCVQYAGRMFYIGERTKVDQFNNLTFDGGSVLGHPAGWTDNSAPLATTLVNSPIFGQSLELPNFSGSAVNPTGTALASIANLNQPAYENFAKTPIIQPNMAYSARFTAWLNAAQATGSVVVELYSPSANQSWKASVNFSTLTTSPLEFSAAMGNPLWTSVPSDLELRVYPMNIVNGATLYIDRIEVFPTSQPVYTNQVAVSYAGNLEAVDSVTGILDISNYTTDPIRNILRFVDTVEIWTDDRTFATTDGTGEPSGWSIKEVSNAGGSIGPLAADVGEEYILTADKRGLYVFDGGNHVKVSQDVQGIWNSIYWPSCRTIWVRNDIANQRVYVGLPLPTPNQWLPDAPANATPASPNVILMLNYLTIPTGTAMAEAQPVTTSMFSGSLLFRDERRKWTLWQIPSPYGEIVPRSNNSLEFWMGGSGTGQIYKLNSSVYTDDGAAILQNYVTYDLSDTENEQQLQLGSIRKLYPYATALIEGSGKFDVTAYPESITSPYSTTQPAFTLANPALDDTNIPLNETGNRMFLQFATDKVAGSWFQLRRIVTAVMMDPKIPVSGR